LTSTGCGEGRGRSGKEAHDAKPEGWEKDKIKADGFWGNGDHVREGEEKTG